MPDSPGDSVMVASWRGSSLAGSPDLIGGKAVGLFSIPYGWTPAFLVLTATFTSLWRRSRKASATFQEAGAEARLMLDELLTQAQASAWCTGIMVRSNAAAEVSEESRGAYTSIFAQATESEVLDAIDAVLGQPADGHSGLCAIAQLAVRRVRGGHLSNERRVSSRRTTWLAEELDAEGVQIGVPYSIDSRRSTGSVSAASEADVAPALRTLAHHFTLPDERFICEWVWDGMQVWAVQRDIAPDRTNAKLAAYLRRRGGNYPPLVRAEDFECIAVVGPESVRHWSKSKRPLIFDQLGMPTATVFLIEGETFETEKARGFRKMRRDLTRILETGWPLVIRCDIREGGAVSDLSLPTSDPTTDLVAALDFMIDRAHEFSVAGFAPQEWAFLPAYLVPASASVMVHARPGAQRIQLDALWGFPDGVGLLPHDTWFHDIARDHLHERQQYKGGCLFFDSATGWEFAAVPSPFDWGHVLNADEIRTASSWARRLADLLQQEVQLMVLARIDGNRGPSAMLPWHFTDHRVLAPGASIRVVPGRNIMKVTQPHDLDSPTPTDVLGLYLQPTVTSRRDPEFLREVGTRAASDGLPVYFEGSVLGHPFYLLRSAGATVVPVGMQNPATAPYEYNKLVRDGIPSIAQRAGSAVRVIHATPSEAEQLLRTKLVEEAFEVLESSDDQTLIDELADLSEVLEAFHEHTAATRGAVESARKAKVVARGSFHDLSYLESTGSPAERVDADPASTLFGLAADEERLAAASRSNNPVDVRGLDDRTLTLRIPLVPPLRNAVLLREYDLRIGEVQLTFRYRGAVLEITIEQLEPRRMPGQLSLPIERT